jgi:hypothetical protein
MPEFNSKHQKWFTGLQTARRKPVPKTFAEGGNQAEFGFLPNLPTSNGGACTRHYELRFQAAPITISGLNS